MKLITVSKIQTKLKTIKRSKLSMSGTQYKNTRGEVVMNKAKFVKILAILSLFGFLSGCMENLNLTTYSIAYPEKNKVYIGLDSSDNMQDLLPPVDDGNSIPLEDVFLITYEKAPSSEVNIVLNGHKIGQHFTYLNDKAKGDVKKFKQYLRHGENVLTVEPTSFGPSTTFYYDAMGPTIIITKGELNGSVVTVEGRLRDFSPVKNVVELKMENVNGYYANGALNTVSAGGQAINVNPDNTFSTTINVSGKLEKPLLYEFKASDMYGYSSRITYLAGDNGTKPLPLENAVRVAIGGSFIEALRPIIANSIYNSLDKAPIDVRDAAWNDVNVCTIDGNKKRGVEANKAYLQEEYDRERQKLIDSGITNPTNPQVFAKIKDCTVVNDVTSCNCPASSGNDGSVFPAGLNPLKVNIGLGDMPTTIKRFVMNDGTMNKPSGAGPRQKGTMILNSISMLPNNELSLSLVITEMLVDLRINAGFLGNLDMGLSIDRTFVDAVALASTTNKKVNIQLEKERSNFQLDGVYATELKILGINIGGLANLILPSLNGLIAGMLADIMNPILRDNLERITIGGLFTQPDTQTSFDERLDIAEMKTDTAFMDYDLIVGLESTTELKVKDNHINPMLGPIFIDDPLNPLDVYNGLSGVQGTNITVAVNTNIINQILNAAYATGVSHFTFYNGKTYYGGNPLTPLASNGTATAATAGETRIRLWPEMPPLIQFTENAVGEGRASVEYQSATLAYDQAVDNNGTISWKNLVTMNVNFDLAVTINENEGSFTMGSAGPPVFQINTLSNNSAIQVPKAIIQRVLDVAMTMGGNILADQMVVVNFGEIAAKNFNGKQVQFLSASDNWKITGTGPNDCIIYRDGAEQPHPNATPGAVTSGKDQKYDRVCQTINLFVSTDEVGVRGNKGGNLFFQMTARDVDAVPAPAIPHFDLDEDGVIDFKDNCALPMGDLAQIISEAGGVDGKLDEDGYPIPTFNADIKNRANKLLAERFGGSPTAIPTTADINHYNNMRTGDPQVTTSNWGSYPWLRMLYSNTSQSNLDQVSATNPDGDRIGDLCENDDDRDGIWESYDGLAGFDNDNCPYIANPGQEDTMYPPGVGDACNVRATFVLLRSYQSYINSSGGVPMCLTHAGLSRTNWVSEEMHTMVPCNPNDAGQRWYMKAVNPNDREAGVEFYDNASRDKATSSRLAAYGYAKTWDYGNAQTRVDELRLVNVNDTKVKSENADSVSKCSVWPCNRSADRADPIWWPEPAVATNDYQQNMHPWYIKTNFNFHFANSSWTNIGAGNCMTYADGNWGVDIDSDGEPYACSTGARWRWAIWVGGTDSPWNGVW